MGPLNTISLSSWGGVVVNCKTWAWAAWAYASARLAGLASGNELEAICPELTILEDDGSDNASTASSQSIQGFGRVCDEVWSKVWKMVHTSVKAENEASSTADTSELVRRFLDVQKTDKTSEVSQFLREPLVDSAERPASTP